MNSTNPITSLILIHGASISGASWVGVVDHLDQGVVASTPDLPGHGTRRGTGFDFDSAIALTIEEMERTGEPRSILVGESLGGYVAMAAAEENPDRVAGLMLIGSSANFTGIRAGLARFSAVTYRLMNRFVSKSWIEKRSELMLRKECPPEYADRVLAGGISADVVADVFAPLVGVDFSAKLGRLDCPIRIVNGEKDFMNRRPAEAFASTASNARVLVVPGASHAVSLSAPRQLAELILGLVEECRMPTDLRTSPPGAPRSSP
jgi:pimeloyl-ACP methyl ester carboxylesterase